MKTQLSLQERLKDLRVEKGLTLEQFPTGISLTWQSSMEYLPTICLV